MKGYKKLLRESTVAAILKIQDGRHLNLILDSTFKFLVPENMVVDTKFMPLSALKCTLMVKYGISAAFLKIAIFHNFARGKKW